MSDLKNYKPKTTWGALGFFGAAWLDLFAEIYDAFPFQSFKAYAVQLRERADEARRMHYEAENPPDSEGENQHDH